MLWLSRRSKGVACPQAQGGQQMWREEALPPPGGTGRVEAVRPSLVYSVGLPPTRAGLFLLHLPKEPDSSSPAASPHSLYGPCMLPWPPFGGKGRI